MNQNLQLANFETVVGSEGHCELAARPRSWTPLPMATHERLTPFMLFFCEMRDEVQREHPTSAPHEVSQIIAEQWKMLPPAQSRAYSVLSATYAEHKKSATSMPKKRKERKERDPKAPKSATSAYMYFSKHHRMLLKQENADLTFGDLGKTVGAMWKAATPEEKKPFEDLAAEDKQRYNREVREFRETATEETLEHDVDGEIE